jgi:hypothetical protein
VRSANAVERSQAPLSSCAAARELMPGYTTSSLGSNNRKSRGLSASHCRRLCARGGVWLLGTRWAVHLEQLSRTHVQGLFCQHIDQREHDLRRLAWLFRLSQLVSQGVNGSFEPQEYQI